MKANEITLGREQNFAIAASFGGPNLQSSIEDANIGELKFILKTWNENDLTPRFRELKTRPCTASDLFVKEGEDQTSYGFYRSRADANLLSEKDAKNYKCIDEPYELFGNYNEASASNLIVTFELCTPELRDTCKSD